jgi:hypothetical protein
VLFSLALPIINCIMYIHIAHDTSIHNRPHIWVALHVVTSSTSWFV